jgi:SAM-dependent methyltransferase
MDSAGWDRRYAGTELTWSAGPNQWVEQVTADLPAGRALDLAAGEGRNALWLAERGWTVTAVDFSAVGLKRARTLAAQRLGEHAGRLRLVVADLRDYTPEQRAYDLVIVAYLQVEAMLRRSVLRAAADAVAPGGLLLVVAHDSANLTRGVGGPQDPAVLYTAHDAAADVDGSGLQVARAEPRQREVSTDDGPRMAIDAFLLAHRPGSTDR